MERKLQERMVGAGVLILALVIVGPIVLDGQPGDGVEAPPVPGQRPEELRSQTFRFDQPAGAGTAMAPAAPVPVETSPPVAAPPAGPPPKAPDTAKIPPAARAAPGPEASLPVAAPESPAVEPAQPAATPPVPVKPASSTRPVAAATTAAGEFVVQVGTFAQKDNAERLAVSLKGRGFAAVVSPLQQGGKTMYRVRVGPAGSRDSARALAGKLAAAGQAGQVVAQ